MSNSENIFDQINSTATFKSKLENYKEALIPLKEVINEELQNLSTISSSIKNTNELPSEIKEKDFDRHYRLWVDNNFIERTLINFAESRREEVETSIAQTERHLQQATKTHRQLEERLESHSELHQKLREVQTKMKANKAYLDSATKKLHTVHDKVERYNVGEYVAKKIAGWKEKYLETPVSTEQIKATATLKNQLNSLLNTLRASKNDILNAKTELSSIHLPPREDLTNLESEFTTIDDHAVKIGFQDELNRQRYLRRYNFSKENVDNIREKAKERFKKIEAFIGVTDRASQYITEQYNRLEREANP